MKLCLRSQDQPEFPRVSIFLRAALRALTVVGLPILVLAPFDTAGDAAPHHKAPPVVAMPTQPSRLSAGSKLRSGSRLVSPNGLYDLEMQSDGNLVLYSRTHALWKSDTADHPGDYATMQGDGNFVIYQGHRAIWSSGTSRGGNSRYYLLLQNDGNLAILSPADRSIWETNTSLGSHIETLALLITGPDAYLTRTLADAGPSSAGTP